MTEDQTVDETFIRDKNIVWYGPYSCETCTLPIVAAGNDFGGLQLDAAHDHHYPNYTWRKHICGVSQPVYGQEAYLVFHKLGPYAENPKDLTK
jgi:hypothetical protein